MTLLFALGAALSFAGAYWQGGTKTFRFWVIGAAGLAAAPLMTMSVAFLWAFLLPGLALAAAFWFKKVSGRLVLIHLISDVGVALAVFLHHQATTDWSIPRPGTWSSGAALIAAAALLRLGSTIVATSRGSTGLALLGWWQGVLLAWLAGPSSPEVLVLGAVGLTIMFIWSSEPSGSSSLLAFGAIIAAVAASNGSLLAVVAVALGGSAFVLGHRVAAVWVVALPLFVPTSITPSFGSLAPLHLLLGLPLGAVAVLRLSTVSASTGGGVTAFAAVVTGLAAMSDDTLRWLLYGAAVSGVVATLLVKSRLPAPEPSLSRAEPPEPRRPLLVVTALCLAINVSIAARLTLIGLSTGFL